MNLGQILISVFVLGIIALIAFKVIKPNPTVSTNPPNLGRGGNKGGSLPPDKDDSGPIQTI